MYTEKFAANEKAGLAQKTVLFDRLRLWAGDSDSLVDELVSRAEDGKSTRAFYLNAHTYNLSCQDINYRKLLDEADILYADGMSIVWAARFSGAGRIYRMTAVDFFDDFLRRAEKEGVAIYVLGGRPGVVDRAIEIWKSRYPAIRIVGSHHGYFGREEVHLQSILADINTSKADILLLGMGSPMQESFANRCKGELQVPVVWALGALFDYYAGEENAAPRWLARMGFEWLYRLCCDPRNKWRRYLIGNMLFIYRAGKVIIKNRLMSGRKQ
jgi:N-acetylglucosaminyldiphosphoundecaprenol N-acetyl-beta-D-mannosaminyltransferase